MKSKRLMAFFAFFIVPLTHAYFPNFTYWPYEAEGCKNTKDQFLAKSSQIQVSYDSENCHVIGGRWKDIFSDETIELASDAIVTTAVPLKFLAPYAKTLSFTRLHSFVHDQNILMILKKNSSSELLYQKNSKALVSLPEKENAKCDMMGLWMDAKSRWFIPMSSEEKNQLVNDVALCQAGSNYNRLESFGPWAVMPGHQCQTRVEILKRDSQIPTSAIDPNDKECTPRLTGQWLDPYSETQYTDAKDLDIDHLVPLKHAYMSGAWKWPYHKKKEYANDMLNRDHLLAVSFSLNRSKGDSSPDKWMPPSLKFHCNYLARWIAIKFRWGLSIAAAEKIFLKEQTKNCPQIYSGQNEILELLSSSLD